MAKELPYFKFFVSEWTDGDITLEDYAVQGLFINICAYYWSKECRLTLTKVQKKFKDSDATALRTLINGSIIKVSDDDQITIKFLDEQFKERENLSSKNAENALKRWKKQENDATAERPHSERNAKSMQYREEKRREEKNKQGFTPPSLLEVKAYFKEKGFTEQSAERAFEYYSNLEWKDSNNKPVKSWKAKMNSVWFKDENRVKGNNAGVKNTHVSTEEMFGVLRKSS